MSRPWHIWASFAACAALVAAAVGWLSVKALQADANEAAARVQAIVEENARLALWRMDSTVASIVAQEAARPYFVYEAFFPADRAYGNMFNGNFGDNRRVRSPLATAPPPLVLLHFQYDSVSGLSSPQGEGDSPTTGAAIGADPAPRTDAILARLSTAFEDRRFRERMPPVAQGATPGVASSTPRQAALTVNRQAFDQQGDVLNDEQQQVRAQNEYQARSRWVQRQAADNTANPQSYGDLRISVGESKGTVALDEIILNPVSEVQVSMMKPLWWGSELLLVRQVKASGRDYVQGCVLDWVMLKEKLLSDSSDLLPHADLVPYESDPSADAANQSREVRLLASLPVSLVPGAVPVAMASGLTPVQLALVLGWTAMLAGAVAVAALLQGVLSLSERRAAFVSAVTHELRTPLTTFRMYSEMLAQGMVTDESDRHRYLETLRIEADRLTHLVANVLSYARLERGRPGRRVETVSVDRLLGIATERLHDRAVEAGFTVAIKVSADVGEAMVSADPSIVEQILFNLVDNACKYAASADDKTLTLSASVTTRVATIRIGDRGPGVSRQEQRRLFQPFRKSASEAAVTAPGVGLGLALSRRLARDMRGDLRYEPGPQGACFSLSLPLAT